MASNGKVNLTTEQEKQIALADELYDRYGKCLEEEHRGEYLAVSPDGRTLLAPTLLEATKQAVRAFGPGSHIFKVGEDAVGEWLCTRRSR